MFRTYGIVGKYFVSRNNVYGNIVDLFQKRLDGDHHGVSDISEVRVVFHLLQKDVARIGGSRDIIDVHIF